MTPDEIGPLLDRFRASRRAFEERVRRIPFGRQVDTPPGEYWSTRDLVARVAAWLEEANDRVPRLLAGAPSRGYDVDAFNVEAVQRAATWTPEQTFGAFRRAADRFDAIVEGTDPADIADCDSACAWLEAIATRSMDEHLGDLDRCAAAISAAKAMQ